MPIVQPDYHGSTHTVSVAVESDLLLRALAYSKMCSATIDSVAKVALTRLLESDSAEFQSWLQQHQDELDTRKLRSFPTGAPRRRSAGARSNKKKGASAAAPAPPAAPQKPTPVAAVGAKG